jgi:1,4-alpha-glucan branching enzyme
MLTKAPSPTPHKVYVTFEFPAASWVNALHLAGDFNQWDERSVPLSVPNGKRVWQVRLELDRGAEYQFRYLVNQEVWHNDWHADGYVPNIHGSDNSLVIT